MIPYNASRDETALLAEFARGDVIEFEFPGLIDDRFNFISGFIYRLLSSFDVGYMSEVALVLLKEILSNCSKANAKRIYFQEGQWDITDAEAYSEAIRDFADAVLQDWDTYQREHAKSDYYIRIQIQQKDGHIAFSVRNNVEILPQEWERINGKLKSFQKYRDINQAFATIRDESEGAGLGIFFMLSLLDSVAIPTSSFKIESANGETQTSFIIPKQVATDEFRTNFQRQVLDEVDELPSFPENVSALIRLCESQNASLQVIAHEISRDPALTAQVLKLVNSAGYMNRWRDPGLEDAVRIIGLKVIRDLLMVTGARNVINKKYRVRDMEAIWEDSNRVSFFARRLAEGKPAVMEQVTVAGLLFELGKIVMLSLRPDLHETVQTLMSGRRIRGSSILEESVLGISHAEIGARMAQRWNFPTPFIEAIRFQQRPLQGPEDYRDIIRTMYFAVIIHLAGTNQIDYYGVEPDILKEFGIDSKDQFQKRVDHLEQNYKASGQVAV